jgi:hypothetical protein
MDLINKDGQYTGSELVWGIEDAEEQAYLLGYELTRDEALLVVVQTFFQNEGLMEAINQRMKDCIEYMVESGQIKQKQ